MNAAPSRPQASVGQAVRGRLITATFAEAVLPTLNGAATPPAAVVRAVDSWSERMDPLVGPATSRRAIVEVVATPLLRILGFQIARCVEQGTTTVLEVTSPSGSRLPVVVVNWSEPLDRAWRAAILDGVRSDARWCCCCNGSALRIVDAHRTWSRQYLEFDLQLLASDPGALTLLWSIARADVMAEPPLLIDEAVELSARHGVAVCRALGNGVLDALRMLVAALSNGHRTRSPETLFDEALTVLYRILFLLFAEARSLVPIWHPIYRNRYSIGVIVGALLERRSYHGVWHAVRAISRLVSAGCAAGELRVTAFNGRLFSPEHAAAFDRAPIADDLMGSAILALSTTAPRRGEPRERITYADLDVEQLGAVYERVLEYQPKHAALVRTREARKASGSFYTPRGLTAFLVRRTLEPLVHDRSAAAIMALRVLDPAMGSGAFLVGVCRYLAEAVEEALVREGRWHPGDVTAADRVALRREIALRCLYGVDLNPMAVQLARLSIWLATLASDKPLSFLDHHLIAGDSLIGATPDDVRRQQMRRRRSHRGPESLPLFDFAGLAPVVKGAVRTRTQLALDPDDTAAIVKAKEQALAALNAPQSPLGRWLRVLDLWCAGWFWDRAKRPDSGAFSALRDYLVRGQSSLPAHTMAPLLEHSDAVATRLRFLHWPLAFPEVFSDEAASSGPGFDAVIGNPPWDMVRGDSGDRDNREARRHDARRLTDFVREAGIYTVENRSHINRYQLFAERSLQLLRPGGRLGLVLPSGVVTDPGVAPLRRHLFHHAAVDEVTGIDNRAGIFPIHRSVRFVLLTATNGTPTTAVSCRFGVMSVDALEAPGESSPSLRISRPLIARMSGEEDLAIPELLTETDLRIVDRVTDAVPSLGGVHGWRVEFGRELNATDDRRQFVAVDGELTARPVLEGKHIQPFRASVERATCQLRTGGITKRVPQTARLAYRDVASATNRLTLIAAIIPARAVTTHTLFCLKTPLAVERQHVLCGLLNSFVANYLIRLRVNTHVSASLMSRLPVPRVEETDPAFERVARLARTLALGRIEVERMKEYAQLQALVARLYGLTETEFEHVLNTFPLIPNEIRSAALREYSNLQ